LVVVCEDLHWADPTSIDLLARLLGLTRRVPLLFICVFRLQQGQPSAGIRLEAAQRYADIHADLCLGPLSANHSQQLIGNLMGVEGLPKALAQRILARAEGNPFYVEEIIRSLLSSGALVRDPASGQWRAVGQVAEIPIPETLNGVLMARIDGLQEETKRALQMASVIGRVFLYGLLKAVVAQPGELDRHLASLQREDMIRERARMPELEYIFKHELTREAAYNSLLKRTRRAVHREVAQALERLFPDRLEQQLGLLAHHWERAEDTRKASEYLLRAGDQARLAYAHQEAIDFYQRAKRVLEYADGGSHEQWLALEEGLADVYAMMAEHDVALGHYDRARGVLAAAGGSPERLAGLCRKTAMLYERKGQYDAAFRWLERGLGALQGGLTLETARMRLAGAGVYSRQGQHDQALAWCQSGMEIARELGDRKELAHGTYLLGTIHGHLGDSAQEIACARDSLTLYQDIGDLVGQANALNNLAIACKESGDWAAAVGHFQRALELEQQLGNVHGVAKVTNNLGNLQLQRGQLDAAARAYQESLDLWQRIEFPVGVALSQSNLAKVCAERGEWQQALDYLEQSLRGFQAIQSNHFLPEVYRRLATVRLGLGQLEEARHAAERSVTLAHDLGMELEKGISLRVLGEVRLALGQLEQARQALTASLDIVQAQGNRFRMGETLWQLSRLHSAMARAGDGSHTEQARSALDRARAIFEQLGAERHLALLEGG
jgi:tetratricopeptide (TPR) repeat protein